MSAPEKVKCQDARLAWAQVLKEQRDLDDLVARAENLLLKYYLRMRPKRTFMPEVLAAA